ncbi:MAG: prepilin-type N-terminal cleavage/methylation domain-containing protein [Patescibacteria group bacterium]|jgi:type IV pilus assembly protein PilE
MKIKRGFTLLEMLVVIGIIAILVTIGFASYSTIQKKARDAKRQGDLKAAQQVMEQCYSANTNSYQYETISVSASNVLSMTCPGSATLTFSIKDPLNTATYKYSVDPNTSSLYTITAVLETSADPYSVSNQQ